MASASAAAAAATTTAVPYDCCAFLRPSAMAAAEESAQRQRLQGPAAVSFFPHATGLGAVSGVSETAGTALGWAGGLVILKGEGLATCAGVGCGFP